MNAEMAGKYPISYVLKKSFPLANTDFVPMLTAPESAPHNNQLSLQTSSSTIPSPGAQKPYASYVNTPPTDTETSAHTKEDENKSIAKRCIDFTEDDGDKSKRQKQDNADNNTVANN